MSPKVIMGAVAVAAVAAFLLLTGGGDEANLVDAEFANAAGLREGSKVRVGGTNVGSVESIKVSDHDTAAIELKLDDEALPLGEDASAAIRAANLLGEKFIDLTVGDRSKPLGDGGISLERTATPVEIDDVIDVLDPTTRGRLALLLGESGIALGERGNDLAKSLQLLPQSVYDFRRLTGEVVADTQVLARLLEESDRVVAAVARERGPLGALIETGAAAVEEPAAQREGLGAMIAATPGTLAQLRSTLQRLDRTGAALRPAAAGLEAVAPSLERTLQALPGFDEAAGPPLATLEEVAPSLTRLGRRGTPVMRRLRPTAATLRGFTADTDDLTSSLDDSAADLLGFTENWARAISTRDSVSHLFRASTSLQPDQVRQLDRYILGLPLGGATTGSRRRGPAAGADSSGSGGGGKGPLGPVQKGLDALLDDLKGVPGLKDLPGLKGVPGLKDLPGLKAGKGSKAPDPVKPLLDFLFGP